VELWGETEHWEMKEEREMLRCNEKERAIKVPGTRTSLLIFDDPCLVQCIDPGESWTRNNNMTI
jgi:hypothetical protein